MSILTKEELEKLKIERMIFHVVRPDSEIPEYLAEVVPPQCPDFFVDRIVETLNGTAYEFLPGSGMPSLLRKAVADSRDADMFIKVSHEIADRFKAKVKQDRRYAPGVVMLFKLSIGKENLASIIKYEHQHVISYSYAKDDNGNSVRDDDGNPIPDLQRLVDTFTQDKKSMQKSAVVRFSADGDESVRSDDSLVIIDHSSRRFGDASLHFENFLDMKRKLDKEDLLKRLEKAALAAIQEHKKELPAEVAKAPTRHIRKAMSQMDGFDHEQAFNFLGAVVGGIKSEAPILKTFEKKLVSAGIRTESFSFKGAKLPSPEYRRVITNEGIAVFFNKTHECDGKVAVEERDEGATIIINSTGLQQNDELQDIPKVASGFPRK